MLQLISTNTYLFELKVFMKHTTQSSSNLTQELEQHSNLSIWFDLSREVLGIEKFVWSASYSYLFPPTLSLPSPSIAPSLPIPHPPLPLHSPRTFYSRFNHNIQIWQNQPSFSLLLYFLYSASFPSASCWIFLLFLHWFFFAIFIFVSSQQQDFDVNTICSFFSSSKNTE